MSAKADWLKKPRPGPLAMLLAGLGVCAFASSGADYLLLDLSADPLSLGGAVTAGLGNSSDLRHNPAGLAQLTKPEAALTHVNAFGDWNHDWLALAYPSSDLGVFAAEASSSQLTPFPYYDDSGNEAGSISAGSQSLGLAWAGRHAASNLSVGSTLRAFSSNLAGFSNWGWGVDIGLRWQTIADGFSAGLALKNLGEQTTYYLEREDLPSSLDLGVCLRDVIGSGQFSFSTWTDARFYADPARGPEVKAGLRLSFWKRVDLSAGWKEQEARAYLHYGAGLDIGFGRISYAYLPDSLLNASHAITLELRGLP